MALKSCRFSGCRSEMGKALPQPSWIPAVTFCAIAGVTDGFAWGPCWCSAVPVTWGFMLVAEKSQQFYSFPCTGQRWLRMLTVGQGSSSGRNWSNAHGRQMLNSSMFQLLTKRVCCAVGIGTRCE